MDPHKQTDHFAKDLTALIDRYRKEYDMVYVEIIGVLHIQAYHLCHEARENNEEEETE